MELNLYQRQVIDDLETFLKKLLHYSSVGEAFNQYWKEKVGGEQAYLAMNVRPYKDTLRNCVHIALKVPTAGGKTFLAVNALHSINEYFSGGNLGAVVWLVPWSNLLQQTAKNLKDPSHPYRQKLSALFGSAVEVFEKDELLQGANFNASSVKDQLNIFVFNFSSLRINSKKREERKIYQENGNLMGFEIDKKTMLEDSEETSLINIIRSLNPVVVVDESHNAESELSVEMLQNLNPSLVLDLTATPKENSNIISYVNALELKKQNMVKLPVMVYNQHRKEEVISNALHLRQELENKAIEEEKQTGKYIRPIVLFQAQPNIKGKENITFENIKKQLIEVGIPEEQIKIKTSGKDELKGVDLLSKDCPVRYIITINALKEGWDCPFAYILASVADRSSAVEVEQILGRILRQPYVRKHTEPLLNLSYVMTASARFEQTLQNIVKGLEESGFSKEDYRVAEAKEEAIEKQEKEENVSINSLFPEEKGDDEGGFDTSKIIFNPSETPEKTISEEILKLTENARQEAENFDKKMEEMLSDPNLALQQNIIGEMKQYSIKKEFYDIAKKMKLPQFHIKQKPIQSSIFEELNEENQYLQREKLLEGFKLSSLDSTIDFESVMQEVNAVDVEENSLVVKKIREKDKKWLLEAILSQPTEKQKAQTIQVILGKMGNMKPISEKDLRNYIDRIFDNLQSEQVQEVLVNDFKYVAKIKEKIIALQDDFVKKKFTQMIDSNEIFTKESFVFPEKIAPLKEAIPIEKPLYEREFGNMNNFEQEVIRSLASLDNVLFWHRNIERTGFALNGYKHNHYPDFIIYTKNGNIILIETKGDHLANEDSAEKNRLGRKWAELSGTNYKYFMVFETRNIENCYNKSNIKEIVGKL